MYWGDDLGAEREPVHMYDTILVPTDESEGKAHVAIRAFDLAQQYDATVHVLHVVDEELLTKLTEIAKVSEQYGESGEDAVERLAEMGRVHGVAVESAIRKGNPASTILEYAEEVGADLIVAGTHRRSGLEQQFVSSVTERLVRYADCPVMTVGLPDTDTTVDDESEAISLARETLAGEDYEVTVTDIDHDGGIWAVEAEAADAQVVVYIDSVTRRRSVVSRESATDA